MKLRFIAGLLAALTALGCSAAQAQTVDPADLVCPRPQPGTLVQPPPDLFSSNDVLEVTLHLRTAFTEAREQRYCYIADMPGGTQAENPTLRVHPGDTLLIHFANDISTDIHPQTAVPRAEHPDSPTSDNHPAPAMPMRPDVLPSPANIEDAPCFEMSMSARGSNLHFHGLSVAPTCHQDEVLHTLVRSGHSFDYRVHIPLDEPPGLYWYHPHPHGYSEEQVLGGASGALIVEAKHIDNDTRNAALPQRLLILRDQLIPEGAQHPHGEHDAATADAPEPPVWDVSLNGVPVLYPAYTPAHLELPSATRETWQILNASADLIVDLEYVVEGKTQRFTVTALDGFPRHAPHASDHLLLPPGARADVVVITPPPGASAQLRTRAVDTGPDGEREPARPIALLSSLSSQPKLSHSDRAGERPALTAGRLRTVGPRAPAYQRTLYFSEHPVDPEHKESYTQFMLTVDGQTPHPFIMGEPAAITVHRGAVEEWIIENRSREVHVFHIHQLHFKVVARDGKPFDDAAMRDTIEVPYWSGSGPYPSVRVRLDFSSRDIVGSFMFHCHILAHEDAGMMGRIDVLPEGLATSIAFVRGGPSAVTVNSSANGIAPTGTVQFQQAGRVLGEVPLHDGSAVLANVNGMTTDVIVAFYSGDRYFAASSTLPKIDSTPTPQPASH